MDLGMVFTRAQLQKELKGEKATGGDIHIHGDVYGAVASEVKDSTIIGTQNNNPTLEEIYKLISQLKEELTGADIPEEEKEVVDDALERVEKQVKKEKPNKEILKNCGNSLKKISEGVASKLIATGILNLPTLIELIGNFVQGTPPIP